MLDAYIIDRIRREQEEARRIDSRLPLHIEHPRPDRAGPDRRDEREREDDPGRGSVVVDYSLR